MDRLKTKGKLYFFIHDNQICWEINKDYIEEILIFDLIKGQEFIKHVENGFITDYDGSLAEILVDGYLSNLGIWDSNLRQGEFCVTAEHFKEICEEFEVVVNWASK